jgi:hypothetical protein
MKFMFGLPTVSGNYDVLVLNSIINQFPYIIEGHHSVQCNVVHNTLIHNARNKIAKDAVEQECDYLFFIDSDCVLPENALKTLVNHNKDIVAGMYFQKSIPHAPVIYKENSRGTYDNFLDYPVNKLIEVDGIGMGICLIKTSVLKNIERPFDVLGATKDHPCINGEDLAFCKRAKAKGYKIFVDTSLQAKHQTVRYIDEDYYLKALRKLKEMQDGANHSSSSRTTG